MPASQWLRTYPPTPGLDHTSDANHRTIVLTTLMPQRPHFCPTDGLYVTA